MPRVIRRCRPLATLVPALLVALPAVPLRAQGARPTTAAEARRDDIRLFRDEFLARDRAYSPNARAAATAGLDRLQAAADTLSRVQLELGFARLVALADNGHTADFIPPRSRHYSRIRLRLTPFGEDFYVLRADSASADLLGARLLAVDGHALAELRAAARSLAGGTPAWRDRGAGFLFESPEQLRALGLAREAGAATYRFGLPNGRTVERRLTADPPDDGRERNSATRWMYPDAVDGAPARALLAADRAPWALQEPGMPFRWRAAPELDAVVVEFRQNRDAPNVRILDFTAAVTEEIRTRAPRNVVVDMRMNGGGDLNTTRDFFKGLPDLVPGRIFVLTSPWTFSAAISSVGYLKQAGGNRVTIVGEMVGDRLNFWAEGSVVQLPYTGAVLLYATERHDYVTGCRPFSDCHGPVVRNPISVPSLAPDIAAPWTIEAYRAGRDPGMEAVAAALAGR